MRDYNSFRKRLTHKCSYCDSDRFITEKKPGGKIVCYNCGHEVGGSLRMKPSDINQGSDILDILE